MGSVHSANTKQLIKKADIVNPTKVKEKNIDVIDDQDPFSIALREGNIEYIACMTNFHNTEITNIEQRCKIRILHINSMVKAIDKDQIDVVAALLSSQYLNKTDIGDMICRSKNNSKIISLLLQDGRVDYVNISHYLSLILMPRAMPGDEIIIESYLSNPKVFISNDAAKIVIFNNNAFVLNYILSRRHLISPPLKINKLFEFCVIYDKPDLIDLLIDKHKLDPPPNFLESAINHHNKFLINTLLNDPRKFPIDDIRILKFINTPVRITGSNLYSDSQIPNAIKILVSNFCLQKYLLLTCIFSADILYMIKSHYYV